MQINTSSEVSLKVNLKKYCLTDVIEFLEKSVSQTFSLKKKGLINLKTKQNKYIIVY